MKIETVIVTRHKGLLDWLQRRGITGKVITGNATEKDVIGKHVYGILPAWLSCLTYRYTEVAIPKLPFEYRGKEFSAEQMDEWGAHMITYIVTKEN